jgi:hypothetical protein
METMSAVLVDLDTKRYALLFAEALPAVEHENDRMLATIEGLMAKGEGNLTAEEHAWELLVARFMILKYGAIHSVSARHTAWSRPFRNSAGSSRAPGSLTPIASPR